MGSEAAVDQVKNKRLLLPLLLLPRLDHFRVCLVDELAHTAQRLATPVAQFRDAGVDQPGGATCRLPDGCWLIPTTDYWCCRCRHNVKNVSYGDAPEFVTIGLKLFETGRHRPRRYR